MKFLSKLILDLLGYMSALCALVVGIYACIVALNQHSTLKAGLLLIAALGLLAVGLLLTFLATDKDHKRFKSRLLENFIISLLPPW